MLYQKNEIIAERYQIITKLSEKEWRTDLAMATYTAFDLYELRSVVLKVFSLCEATDSKPLKLFLKREAEIFLSLDYHSIPKYLNYFESNTDGEHCFYLVRESVSGKCLAELVADGWKPNETQLKELIIQLLDTLNYLHSQSIVHQNIKPANIIIDKNNRVYLVDYGAIENIFSCLNTNSRIGGSFEVNALSIYRPMEHAIGKPVFASDLYSFGYCLILLLTGKSPSEFALSPDLDKLDLTTQINVSPDFQRWLSRMIEYRFNNRFESAAAAIKALPSKLTADSGQLEQRPTKYKLAINHQPDCLKYRLFTGDGYPNSREEINSGMAKVILAIAGLFVLPELTIVGICLWLFYLGHADEKPQLDKSTESTSSLAQEYVALEIYPQVFCLERTVGVDSSGVVKIKREIGKTSDIYWVDNLGKKRNFVVIATRQKNKEHQYTFGDRYLSQKEAIAIIAEIKQFIATSS